MRLSLRGPAGSLRISHYAHRCGDQDLVELTDAGSKNTPMTQQKAQQRPVGDPRRHTMQIKERLDDLIRHLREDVGKVSDPKAEALFETTAEVLGGLRTAYEHFEQESEEAWR